MRRILICLLLALSCLFVGCNNSDDHEWSLWKDNYDGLTHSRVCKNNDEHIETKDHNYDNGLILQQVSDLQNGVVLYSCIDCGYEKETIIPPTGNHNFVDEIVDDERILRKVSSATSVYYKSCSECGAFGNADYIFEDTNLPDEYLELEYIEGTGKQYIDTLYSIKSNNVKIEMKFKLPSSINDLSLFGSRNSSQEYDLVPYHADSYGTRVFKFWVGSTHAAMKITLQPGINNVVYTINGNKLYCTANNNDTISANFNGSGITGLSLYIFGLNSLGSPVEQGSGYSLYSFKLYDNNILVRDFVPAYNMVNNENGLYDLVSNSFFNNVHKLNGGNTTENNTLPEGFTEIEYIESIGNQYIDTKVDKEAVWEFDMQFALNGSRQLMGYGSAGSEYFGVQPDGTYGVLPSTSSLQAGNRDIIVFDHEGNEKYLGVNGENVVSLGDTALSSTFKLFALNNKCSFACEAKLYSAKCWQDGILVRDYVPCIRDIDGKFGLYDLVTEEFFTYNQDFNFGKIQEDESIPSTYTAVEYLESDGNQYIDTGIVPSGSSLRVVLDYQYTSDTGNQSLFGTTSEARMSLNAMINDYKLWQFGSNGWKNYLNQSTCDMNRHIADCFWGSGSQYFKVDGDTIYSDTLGQFTDSSTLRLFNHYDRYYSSAKFYSCKIYYGESLVRDFVPVVRNEDGKPGFFDKITQIFYGNSNDVSFQGGNIAGHDFDDGVVIKETTYYQDGDIVYTCKVCGKQIHKYEDKYAHKVEFKGDNGVKEIKVFKDYNPNDFEITSITYSRNKNTFNYSKIDSIIIFEIVLKDGFEIDEVRLNKNSLNIVELESNRFIVNNINSDLEIEIITKSVNK